MFRILLICLIPFLPQFALSYPASDTFDARRLSWEEKRFAQAALSFSGAYSGLLDGAWGRGSQSALEQELSHIPSSDIRFGHLRPMLRRLHDELRVQNWQVLDFDDDISYLIPNAILTYESDASHPTIVSADRSLLIRELAGLHQEVRDQHEWLIDNHAGPGQPYRSWNSDRMITSATLSEGKKAYLISYPRENYLRSTLVQFEPKQASRARVVIASFYNGSQPNLTLPQGGLLAALLANNSQTARVAQAKPAPKTTPPAVGRPSSAARGSGTGFYINSTDIVTAAHVIDGCSALSLEDGTPLWSLDADVPLDLAILSSSRRSTDFLPLTEEADARLGQKVFALGFPYRGLFDQGLTVTGGNLSALPGLNDPAKKLMFSAPVQPGNSGGPLLNRSGQVMGVIVSRANDLTVLGETGTLPQNINFAVSIPPLENFLRGANILFPRGADYDASMEDGVPDRVQGAVVSILCY